VVMGGVFICLEVKGCQTLFQMLVFGYGMDGWTCIICMNGAYRKALELEGVMSCFV